MACSLVSLKIPPDCSVVSSSSFCQPAASLGSTSCVSCRDSPSIPSSRSAQNAPSVHASISWSACALGRSNFFSSLLASFCRHHLGAMLKFSLPYTACPGGCTVRCLAEPWSRQSERISTHGLKFGLFERAGLGPPSCTPAAQRFGGRKRTECEASGVDNVGSLEWMSKATPYEVLGVEADCSEDDVKSAFRARIKDYHPDVYQGVRDADAITQRLLRAYELLTGDVERTQARRKSLDPFEAPECVAKNLFVNELACLGQGCPYSCVDRAPGVFQFASDTARARVANQDAASSTANEYDVHVAVGQCPQNCIHYLTPEQRFRLEEILQSVLEGTMYSGEAFLMDGLIAKANFENGRYQSPDSPKRRAKKTEEWVNVDWF